MGDLAVLGSRDFPVTYSRFLEVNSTGNRQCGTALLSDHVVFKHSDLNNAA
jgi:hypothetical protein